MDWNSSPTKNTSFSAGPRARASISSHWRRFVSWNSSTMMSRKRSCSASRTAASSRRRSRARSWRSSKSSTDSRVFAAAYSPAKRVRSSWRRSRSRSASSSKAACSTRRRASSYVAARSPRAASSPRSRSRSGFVPTSRARAALARWSSVADSSSARQRAASRSSSRRSWRSGRSPSSSTRSRPAARSVSYTWVSIRRSDSPPYVASSRSRSGSPSAQNSASAVSNASTRRTAAWLSSSSRKRGSSPAAKGCAFRSRLQKPWIVEIHAPSSSRARSRRPRATSAARMRDRSSPAALRVYVITRIESTSSPSSQTARTKRSTRTDVLPVPAPAETKTSPPASTAASCSGFIWAIAASPRRCHHHLQARAKRWDLPNPCKVRQHFSRPRHPAHRPQVAPGRALAALRVVADVARLDPPRVRRCPLARGLDLRPELVLAEVVALREAGHVLLRLGAQHPARGAPPGQRAVDAAERLDPDEVAKHEHVERDLEPELGFDRPRRVDALARLVVLHDPARRERRHVDAVDLPGQVQAGLELETALELGS